jgi:hypothetical protein
MSDSVNQKINALAAKIDAQANKARTTQVVTIVVGLVFVVVLLGYFAYMSSLTRQALEPEGVANVLSDAVTSRVKGVNKEAQSFIKSEAPKIMNDVITRAIDEQIPGWRANLEAAIKEQSSELLQKYEDEIYKGVDETLAKYGENLKTFAANLRTEEGTKEFEDAIYKVIDEAINMQEIRMDVEMYGEALQTIDGMLERLVTGEDLSQDEQALLRLLGVIREITRRSELNSLSIDLSMDVDTPGLENN